MGIRPRGQRELDRDQELEEAEEDPQEPARCMFGKHRPERRARHDPRRQVPDHRPADRAVAVTDHGRGDGGEDHGRERAADREVHAQLGREAPLEIRERTGPGTITIPPPRIGMAQLTWCSSRWTKLSGTILNSRKGSPQKGWRQDARNTSSPDTRAVRPSRLRAARSGAACLPHNRYLETVHVILVMPP